MEAFFNYKWVKFVKNLIFHNLTQNKAKTNEFLKDSKNLLILLVCRDTWEIILTPYELPADVISYDLLNQLERV